MGSAQTHFLPCILGSMLYYIHFKLRLSMPIKSLAWIFDSDCFWIYWLSCGELTCLLYNVFQPKSTAWTWFHIYVGFSEVSFRGRGGSLEVKDNVWSCRRPRLSSKHSHGGLWPSLSSILGKATPSSDLHNHQAHKWYIHTYIHKHVRKCL